MYWDLGQLLYKAQHADGWGKGTLARLSADMKNEYPEEKGFSVRNFQCMMQFYEEYNQELTMVKQITQRSVAQLQEYSDKLHNDTIVQRAVAQLPEYDYTLPVKHLSWAHNVVLMQRVKDIELKNTEFKPEYIGKLNFYCSAVDDVLCREGDNKTIGLLLCKTKDKIKAEYALRDINKPIGISDYELGQALPKDLRSSLPSIEDIEAEFDKK